MIFVSTSATLLLLFSSVCHGLVETCEELQAAFELTKTQDVVVQVDPNVDIDCVEMTTMSMDSNTLTVESSEGQSYLHVTLNQVRFEVTNGAKLFWEPNVEFYGTDKQDVNGGGLFVGADSTVRFRGYFEMFNYGIQSVPEEGSDYASYFLDGGCVHTNGYFRVDGEATFSGCNVNSGGGGALYVGEQGSVLFKGGLDMSDIAIFGDFGTHGGGIYNFGNVNIKGDAKFEELRARSGGAIYNAEGAQFRFKNGAKAIFIDCTAHDGTAGALHNAGYLKFSGPALFVETYTPAIYVASGGKTVLSKNSVFWDDYEDNAHAIGVHAEGELVIPSSVSFIESSTDCSRVRYYGDDAC